MQADCPPVAPWTITAGRGGAAAARRRRRQLHGRAGGQPAGPRWQVGTLLPSPPPLSLPLLATRGDRGLCRCCCPRIFSSPAAWWWSAASPAAAAAVGLKLVDVVAGPRSGDGRSRSGGSSRTPAAVQPRTRQCGVPPGDGTPVHLWTGRVMGTPSGGSAHEAKVVSRRGEGADAASAAAPLHRRQRSS